MDYSTGRLGQGGAQERAVEIRFNGVLGPPFVQFVLTRARRLDLRGWVQETDGSVVVAVEGPEALIDAFEITCSLGPIESRIESWSRTEHRLGSNAQGFGRRF